MTDRARPRPCRRPAVLLVAALPVTVAPPAQAQANDEAGEDGEIEEILVQGRLTRYSALKSDTPILETARSARSRRVTSCSTRAP